MAAANRGRKTDQKKKSGGIRPRPKGPYRCAHDSGHNRCRGLSIRRPSASALSPKQATGTDRHRQITSQTTARLHGQEGASDVRVLWVATQTTRIKNTLVGARMIAGRPVLLPRPDERAGGETAHKLLLVKQSASLSRNHPNGVLLSSGLCGVVSAIRERIPRCGSTAVPRRAAAGADHQGISSRSRRPPILWADIVWSANVLHQDGNYTGDKPTHNVSPPLSLAAAAWARQKTSRSGRSRSGRFKKEDRSGGQIAGAGSHVRKREKSLRSNDWQAEV